MAWEWVAPVATAGTGATGIFFTWLTAKQARDSEAARQSETRKIEQKRQVRDERREAYVGMLEGLAKLDDGLRNYVYNKQQGMDYNQRSVQFLSALEEAQRRYYILELAAPPSDVVHEVEKALHHVTETRDAIDDERSSSRSTAKTDAIIRAMSADLGYPVHDSPA